MFRAMVCQGVSGTRWTTTSRPVPPCSGGASRTELHSSQAFSRTEGRTVLTRLCAPRLRGCRA
jgi:hypothetical protein